MPDKPDSLGSILDARRNFIGRKEQLDLFMRNLRLSPYSDERSFIISVSGNGGVGKTWLLRQFRKQAQEAGAVTASVDKIHDIPDAMQQIADQLASQGFALKKFAAQYQIYRQKRQALEEDPDAPPGLAGYLTQLALGAGLKMLRAGAGLGPYGALFDVVEDSEIAKQVGQWTNYIHRRIARRDEKNLILDPIHSLTTLFLSDLNNVAQKRTVVLFWDNYEELGNEVDQWLRDILGTKYGPISLKLLLVIAGRQELDRVLWADFEPLLTRLRLDVFTEEETEEYLKSKGIEDHEAKNALIRASMRLPVLLAMLTSVMSPGTRIVHDPSDSAVELFLRHIKDSNLRSVAVDCALPSFVNRDIVAVVIGRADIAPVWEWLRKMPFIEQDGNVYRYHPVVREMMLRHKKRTSVMEWDAIHNRLEKYYREERDKLGLDGEAALSNERWRAISWHIYYHHLCQTENCSVAKQMNWFLSETVERVRGEPRFSITQRWADVMRQVGHDSGVTELEEWGGLLVAGLKAYEAGPFEVAVDLFTRMLKEPFISEKWHGVLLGRRGNAYRRMGEYDKSLEDLNNAIQLAPEIAWVISGRAITYLRLGRKEEALADLNRALELEPDFAPDLSRRGWLLAEMGQTEQATADLKRALELSPDWYIVVRNVSEGFRAMKRYEMALECLNAYIRQHPDDAEAYELRNQIHQESGNMEKGQDDLQRPHLMWPHERWLEYIEYKERWTDYPREYADSFPMC
ncbi:MAG: tetratricopeptide repeat protein [Anaerolineales bacterium]